MKAALVAILLALPVFSRADIVSAVTQIVQVLELDQMNVNTGAVERAVLEGVARSIDPGARLVNSNELLAIRNRQRGLVFQAGLRLAMSNSAPVVVDVAKGFPADKAGLNRNDVLTSIDGAGTSNITIESATRLLRSDIQKTIRLTVNETNELQLTLELLELPDVESIEEWPENLAYVRFNGLVRTNLAPRFSEWTSRAGLVLDLRGATGSDADLARALSDSCKSADIPVIALVDGQTTGAAELLAAHLSSDVQNALILGQTTSGDPLLRGAVALPSGDFLYCTTTQRLVMSNGTTYDGHAGVVPDIAVGNDASVSPFENGPDELDHRVKSEEESEDRTLRNRTRGDAGLVRAVDILLGLKALEIHGNDTTENPDR